MTALFFIYLAIAQLSVAALGAATVLALAAIPMVRPRRGQLLGCAISTAVGGFVGTVAGFAAVIAASLLCQAGTGLHLVTDCTTVADLAVWGLMAGYLVGSFAGGVLGWRSFVRRAEREHAIQ